MKKTVKIYEEQGIRYRFDSERLSVLINKRKQSLKRKKDNNATKANITCELAEKLFVSNEAIKNWMYGYNGPSDFEQVKQIGDYFGIDYHELLKKEDLDMISGSNQMLESFIQNSTTREVIRKLYKDILHFMDSCDCTYCDLILDVDFLKEEEYETFMERVSNSRCELSKELQNITDFIVQSYLDIPEKFYGVISDYCWGRLDNLANSVTAYETDDELYGKHPFLDDGICEELDDYFDNGKYINEVQELFKEFVIR